MYITLHFPQSVGLALNISDCLVVHKAFNGSATICVKETCRIPGAGIQTDVESVVQIGQAHRVG